MTYNELVEEAKSLYNSVAKNSPFVAQFEARKFIASKIDQCSDRNEHLNVLEWEEYKEFAPMKRETFRYLLNKAREDYYKQIDKIKKDYEEKGKYSPDYHKI